MNAASPQAAMQAWLLHAAPGMAARIAGGSDVDRAHRLRIYADAYRLRLLQVLAEDYPVLRKAVGGDAFDRLCTGYLSAHPSRHPSVRWLGAGLPDWLHGAGQPEARVALARFEWAQGELFDAADALPCDEAALRTLQPEAWPSLRLELIPALRLHADIGNAPDRAAAVAEGHAPARWRRHRVTWLLWRQHWDVHWRALPADEARALACVSAGGRFADWCGELAGPQPALRAAGLLKRWLADGLIIAVHTDPPAPALFPSDST
ncbi:DNA-binding domain-containing protein [Stenotrophomonas sp. HITSZ_GD]|uniref:HvfC/BufC N-terminal domain-containing protein n=1 Tax=Stenotrophomonas sp. HITSZ_GD TaxID=3037248 RepID=UPI00240E65A3|nr:DNA-binding domain-containing protein [Stenotrophomonas sp. HITSZ_GD]MDG2523960.1 DNA-binding domain-containing protein [Stenotrophomonas sp. HITSZ_GD]